MTGRLCGAPHHQHPETLCTEPAGHYRRDRDPHAGPLIIGGRECGGAAWDEPKEQPVTRPPAPPRQPVTTWTLAVLRRCYRGEKPQDVLERALRMLAGADGHLTADGRIKTRNSGTGLRRPG